MITCLSCGADKDENEFYTSATPEDPTYHFCKECAKAESRKNYLLAKRLIEEESTITAVCYDCLLEKEAKHFTPCQLGSFLTGFWCFCRLCANERSRVNRTKKREASKLVADLLGEKATRAKRVTKSKRNKRKTVEKQQAEAAFLSAQHVEDLVQKLHNRRNKNIPLV